MRPIRLVKQRRRADCGVACFATWFGLAYEDAAEIITLVLGGKLGGGVYLTTLQRAAAHLGKRLKKQRRYDLEEAEGILWVGNHRGNHFVVLFEGLIYDPEDMSLWEADDFLKNYSFAAFTLLAPAD